MTSCWNWLKIRISLPLALALLLSLCLHLGLLSGIPWSLVGRDGDGLRSAILVAHLQPRLPPPDFPVKLAAGAKSLAMPNVINKPHKTAAARTPSPQIDPLAVPDSIDNNQSEAHAKVNDTNQTGSVGQDGDVAESTAQADEQALQTLEDAVLPAPYQSVETDYDVYLNGEKKPSGSANIHFHAKAGQYSLRWEIQGNGLLRLLYPKLIQESRGDLTQAGLQPMYYKYAFGNKADKTYEADFQWSERILTLKTAKGVQEEDLPLNTQDLLSFMYQFMYVPPTQEMRVTLTNGKRLGEYEYEFEGEETLEIAGKPCNTMHIAHTRGETDEKVELWLATDYRNVPVKIRKTEKNGTVIEQLATRLIAE